MLKRLVAAALFFCVGAGGAWANCPALPYTFTNGSLADATQVNQNFTTLENCANSGQITVLGTVTSGTWQGSPIGNAYLSITSPTQQEFLSGTGTYTTPAGVKWIEIELQGGGQGGASGDGGGSASAGGTTSFGTIGANGGGGAGAGTTVNCPTNGVSMIGSAGSVGTSSSAGVHAAIGGNGGASPFGGAGPGQYNGAGSAANANSGAGGAGGGATSTATTRGGTGGQAGGYCRGIIVTPASSYSYGVGAGTAGNGSPGANGFSGGAGAAGFLRVIEHYN